MPEMAASRLLVIAALALATPAAAFAKADPCQGKAERDGEGRGVAIGARTNVKVVVVEVKAPRRAAKFTLENDVREPPLDLTAARKGTERTYHGPLQLHACAREFHAPESCFNKVRYRPGIIDLETAPGFRVRLKVSCK